MNNSYVASTKITVDARELLNAVRSAGCLTKGLVDFTVRDGSLLIEAANSETETVWHGEETIAATVRGANDGAPFRVDGKRLMLFLRKLAGCVTFYVYFRVKLADATGEEFVDDRYP